MNNDIARIAALINEDPNLISEVSGTSKAGVTTIEILDKYLLELVSSGAINVDDSKFSVKKVKDIAPDDTFGKPYNKFFIECDGHIIVSFPMPQGVIDTEGYVRILHNGEVIDYLISDLIGELNSYSIFLDHIKESIGAADMEEVKLSLVQAAYNSGNLMLKFIGS